MSEPTEQTTIEAALQEINEVLEKHNLAGYAIVTSHDSTNFTFPVDRDWNAIRFHPKSGSLILSKSGIKGADAKDAALKASLETIMSMSSTMMNHVSTLNKFASTICERPDVKRVLKKAGITHQPKKP